MKTWLRSNSRSVVDLAVLVADKLGLDEREQQRVQLVGLSCDVGKMRIPNAILNKPGPLSDEEWKVVRTHSIQGEQLLDQVGGALGSVSHIVRATHERWDGHGYPDRLSGPSIPLAARIVSCCAAYVAMTTERPFRTPMSQEIALRELVDNAGTQFDPEVVKAFISVVRRSVFTGRPELAYRAELQVAPAQ